MPAHYLSKEQLAVDEDVVDAVSADTAEAWVEEPRAKNCEAFLAVVEFEPKAVSTFMEPPE